MRSRKISELGIPSFYVVGAGLSIVSLIALFLIGYFDYRKTITGYSHDDLKRRNSVIWEQEIYEFMNFALFDADSIQIDKREYIKINCFALRHSSDLKSFINSQHDSVLSSQDKKHMMSQFEKTLFLWDQEKLINVWCLTPKDLFKAQQNDTADYWENFRFLFGNYGHHHYSKPIFNKAKNLVIIEHSGQGDWLLGSGAIMLFRKVDEKWQLIYEHELWIS